MKFILEITDTQTIIHAEFDDDDHPQGPRQEGAGTIITYSHEPVTFDYQIKKIHPDLFGLLCLIIFYPFIGKRVEFPEPVSPRLVEAFKNACFDRQFEFVNVDNNIPKYRGEKPVLSFGGGIDSSAVRSIFPEVFIVHEAHIRNGDLLPSHSHEVVHALGPEKGRVVVSNQRYISTPGGWHGWPCSTAGALLLATDYNFGLIMTGSILGSTLLSNGNKYWIDLLLENGIELREISGNHVSIQLESLCFLQFVEQVNFLQ